MGPLSGPLGLRPASIELVLPIRFLIVTYQAPGGPHVIQLYVRTYTNIRDYYVVPHNYACARGTRIITGGTAPLDSASQASQNLHPSTWLYIILK